jgi:lipopolysaccharide/colanic/teichoic acid biosynthesis glycosyltransferase
VLFLQHRYGFNQKPFRIIKFRTMRTLDDGPFILQAKRDDPRVTKLGSWLRRWNIDEIPQLFNVLKGDMSLVGPRPHALSHNREYEQRISLYARRHNVKPGITGWAQINGFRGETDSDRKMQGRVEYDLYYIDNWSLGRSSNSIRTLISPSSPQRVLRGDQKGSIACGTDELPPVAEGDAGARRSISWFKSRPGLNYPDRAS